MKTTTLFLGALSFYLSAVFANAGTIFTYQGRLASGQTAANGLYEMQFSLFDAATNGNPVGADITLAPVQVTNGIFTVGLDFGSAAFTGAPRWLEISLTVYGSDQPVTTLHPRQRITSTPYAILADNVSGPIPDSQLSSNIARLNSSATFAGPVTASAFSGNGSGLSNVHALSLEGFGSDDFWRLGGNSGTTAGVNFVGTTDNQPLELKVNGQRALRLEPGTNGAPNIIGGSVLNSVGPATGGVGIGGGSGNVVEQGSHYSVVAGGLGNLISSHNESTTISGGFSNRIGGACDGSTISGGGHNQVNSPAYYSSVGGGWQNVIETMSDHSTISGGSGNRIVASDQATISGGVNNFVSGIAKASTIGGGGGNVVGGFSPFSVIAGGETNYLHGQSQHCTIGGGVGNRVGIYNERVTIAGGGENFVGGFRAIGGAIGGGVANSNYGSYATIPGGLANYAAESAFAAGTRAKAAHEGAFVWSDPSPDAVSSTTTNQFTARASGGVRFFTDAAATAGAELAPGSGSWSSLSDRNAKTNFTAIVPRDVLERVASLPIQQWSYKTQAPAVRHVGPTAQDFHAAFGVGEDATRISSVDADGVALAAIQGLHSLLKEKDNEIENLKQRLAAIEALLLASPRQ